MAMCVSAPSWLDDAALFAVLYLVAASILRLIAEGLALLWRDVMGAR